MFSNILGSWKTSLAGVAGILTGLGQLINLFQQNGLAGLGQASLGVPISLISLGIGHLFSKD